MKVFKGIVFFIFFSALFTVLFYWLGFFTLNPFLVAPIALIASWFLLKEFENRKIPVLVLFPAVIVLFLCAMPFLLFHPFYMASNDSLHTITLRVLDSSTKIPSTYEPYSGISFTYQFGFHLFAKLFNDLFSSLVPDYAVLWVLGLIFAFLQPILMYFFSLELFDSKKTALFSAALFAGTKTVYQDMLFGLFPRLMAACLILLALYLYLKKSHLYLLLVPAILIVHPGYALAFFLILFFLHFFQIKRIEFKKLLVSGLAAIPVLAVTYSVVFQNLFLGTSNSMSNSGFNFLNLAVAVWPWIGWLPALLFFIALPLTVWRKEFNQKNLLALALIGFFLILFFSASALGVFAANVFIFPLTLGMVLFDGSFLGSLKFSKKKVLSVFGLMLVFSFFSFFASGYLMAKANGSKISPEEAEFALEFQEFDSKPRKTLILAEGAAKIAELSNKALFNTANSFFLPKSTIIHNSAWEQKMENEEEFNKIVNQKCFDCICDLNVKYVVFKGGFVFDKALFNKKPLLEVNNLKLFKKDNLCSGIE